MLSGSHSRSPSAHLLRATAPSALQDTRDRWPLPSSRPPTPACAVSAPRRDRGLGRDGAKEVDRADDACLDRDRLGKPAREAVQRAELLVVSALLPIADRVQRHINAARELQPRQSKAFSDRLRKRGLDSDATYSVADGVPMARTPSKSPLIALHGPVTHGPHRAEHFHNLHQAQPLDDWVDPGSILQRWLKGQPSFSRQHRTRIGAPRRQSSMSFGVIREAHREVPAG